jgi:hypothetical protein
VRHRARALVGYLPRDEALQLLAGRAVDEAEEPALEHTWRRVRQNVERRPDHAALSPLQDVPPGFAGALEELASTPEVQAAMGNLDWSMGFADPTRGVLSSVRAVDLDRAAALVDGVDLEPRSLVDLCLPTPRSATVEGAIDAFQMTFTTSSMEPNLRIAGFEVAAVQEAGGQVHQVMGVRLASGPSFVQLAEYRGRWLLRDGYHRVVELLRRSVTRVPCVVIRARTFEETGAGRPGLFGYETLFGPRPPLVTDFLDDDLSADAATSATLRVIRVRAEEYTVPVPDQPRSSEPG